MIPRHMGPGAARRFPAVGSLDEYCAIHGFEPVPPGAYRVCGECWHVYRTAEELVDAYNAQTDELKAHYEAQRPATAGFGGEWAHVRDPGQVHFCPLCAHDW